MPMQNFLMESLLVTIILWNHRVDIKVSSEATRHYLLKRIKSGHVLSIQSFSAASCLDN